MKDTKLKIENLSATQILREINYATSTILDEENFYFDVLTYICEGYNELTKLCNKLHITSAFTVIQI